MQTERGPGRRQMQLKGLRLLRAMFEADGERLRPHAGRLPRHLRREPDVLRRQRHLVLEDAMPARRRRRHPHPAARPPWLDDLLRLILQHECTAAWRTSSTARQTISLVQHFLVRSGLLAECAAGLPDFLHRAEVAWTAEELRAAAQRFLDAFCRSPGAVRRYRHVINLLFHRIWRRWPEPFRANARRPRPRTLRELDCELSESSVGPWRRDDDGTEGRGHAGGGRDHWRPAELARLRAAAAAKPRDHLVVTLLLVTGLRRRGLLNLRCADVAQRDREGAPWVAVGQGQTLTKGLHQHHFRLTADARSAVERYLNAPEDAGGRPRTPSPFLLPSGVTDNGQLSTAALSRLFKRVCARAGFAGDPRAHLHSMRHTHAHQLLDAGNDMRVVQASLGHRRMQTTERYVRETLEDVMEQMRVPEAWACLGPSPQTNAGMNRTPPPPTTHDNQQEATAARETLLLREMLKARWERNELLRRSIDANTQGDADPVCHVSNAPLVGGD